MSYLSDVLSPDGRRASDGFTSAFDPRYWEMQPGWGDDSRPSAAGIHVNAENAMSIGAVYRCVSILAGVVSYLSLHIYKRLEGGGKERATQHPLYRLFQLKPNGQNTVEHWLRLVVAHLELRGNSYHEIVPGPRGIVDKLIPLHPARVTPEVNNADGRGWCDARFGTMTKSTVMRYVVTRDSGVREVLTEDEVFHIRGLGSNGLVGLSRVSLMAETLGLSIATDQYAARSFSNGASYRGVFRMKDAYQPDAYARLKMSIAENSGLRGAHKTLILEQGAEFQQIGMSNEDAQMLETKSATAAQICGWFGVPPHLVAITDKSTSWGSGIAEQNLALLVYTIAPILEAIEQAIDAELIVADQTYFAEFLPDKLLRMDPKASAEAENIALMNGTVSRNEVRAINNRNPVPGGDDYMVPLNMQVVGAPLPLPARVEAAGALVRGGWKPDEVLETVSLPPMEHVGLPPVTLQAPRKPVETSLPLDEDAPDAKAASPFGAPAAEPMPEPMPDEAMNEPDATEEPAKAPQAGRESRVMGRAAKHCVAKENNWLRTWGPRLAADEGKWRDKVAEFYATHAAMVVNWELLPEPEAAAYCAEQQAALLEAGPVAHIAQEDERVAALVALAVEVEAAA